MAGSNRMRAKSPLDSSKATITDVADRAKVSVGTVSHVLSGRIPVSATLRERVMQAIEDLGYEPNFHARGLRGRHSSVIGLCFPNAHTVYPNTLAETMERIGAASGCSILHVFSRHDSDAELQRVRELLNYRVGGLILFPSLKPQRTLDLVHAADVPMVVVDRLTDGERFDHVVLDNRRTMEAAAAQLIAMGHQRILFIVLSRQNRASQHRIEGLEAARGKAGVPVQIRVVEYGEDESYMEEKLVAALNSRTPPTVVITSNSHQAALVLRRLRKEGIDCPRQVSLMTFDDPDWASLVTPSLSVIRQPAEDIATTAWDLLMSRMKDHTLKPRLVALEAEIEMRNSVVPPAKAAG